MSLRTELEDIREIFKRAISRLREVQGSDGGWPGNKPSQKSGIWTTAAVILALLQCGERLDACILRGVKFLIDQENSDGGWSSALRDNRSVAEASACTILALSELAKRYDKIEDWEFFGPFKKSLRIGTYWFLGGDESGVNPPKDGGWSTNRYDREPRTVSTSLAVRALLESKEAFRIIDPEIYGEIRDEIVKDVEAAVRWLTSPSIYKNGCIVWAAGEEVSVVATAYVILSLIKAGQDRDTSIGDMRDIIKKCTRWLKSRQKSDGSWENELEDRSAGWIYKDFFTTPWVILALMNANERIIDFNLLQGITWLRDSFSEKKGYWQLNGKEMYIWPTSYAVSSLNAYLTHGEKEEDPVCNTVLSFAKKLRSYRIYKSTILKLEGLVALLSLAIVGLLAILLSVSYPSHKPAIAACAPIASAILGFVIHTRWKTILLFIAGESFEMEMKE